MRGPKRLKILTKIRPKQLEAKAIELFEENKNVYGSRRLSEAFIKCVIQTKVATYSRRMLPSIHFKAATNSSECCHPGDDVLAF